MKIVEILQRRHILSMTFMVFVSFSNMSFGDDKIKDMLRPLAKDIFKKVINKEGDTVTAPELLEVLKDHTDLSVLGGIQLTPNEFTLRAIQEIQNTGLKRHTTSIPHVRLVGKNGMISRTIQTIDEKTIDACRRECSMTNRCNAFVVKNSDADQIGGYCGLVFDELYRRYDRYWVSGSHGYSSYLDSSVREPRIVPLRFVLRYQRRDKSRYVLKRHVIDEFERNNSHTRIDSVLGCAKRCASELACTGFLKKRNGICYLFDSAENKNANAPLTEVIYSIGDSTGVVQTFAEQSKFDSWGIDNGIPQGLSLFAPSEIILSNPNRTDLETREKAARLSALVAPVFPGGHAWLGDSPPYSNEGYEIINLSSFIDGAEGRSGYLPFDETLWASKSEPGTYFFVPRKYRFAWDKVNNKLGGSQFFNAAGTIGNGEDVRLTIKLSGTFNEDDINVLEQVANAYLTHQGKPPIKKLKRLPLEDSPVIDLASSLRGLGVNESQLEAPTMGNDLVAPLLLTFNVNDLTAQSLLENFSAPDGQTVGGSLHVGSREIESEEISIPIVLNARDPATYGGERVVNGRWKNISPYPTKVLRLNMLLIRPDKAEILSWNADIEHPFVDPGQSVRFDLGSAAESLVPQAKRIWVEYTIDQSCRECASKALGLAAVTGAARSSVMFSLLPGFRDSDAFDQIKINFRSQYLSADSNVVQPAESMFLSGDSNSVESPQIFLPDGMQLDNDQVGYQYRVTKYSDGNVQCIPWTDGSEQDVVLTPDRFAEVDDACTH